MIRVRVRVWVRIWVWIWVRVSVRVQVRVWVRVGVRVRVNPNPNPNPRYLQYRVFDNGELLDSGSKIALFNSADKELSSLVNLRYTFSDNSCLGIVQLRKFSCGEHGTVWGKEREATEQLGGRVTLALESTHLLIVAARE